MQVRITTDPTATEPWIEIHANAADERMTRLAEELERLPVTAASTSASASASTSALANTGTDTPAGNRKTPVLFSAWNGDLVTILKPEGIMRFYSLEKKVYAETDEGVFQIKRYLYEIEEILAENGCHSFFRISNSEIVNFDFIKNLDMSFSGTIHINFKNGGRSVVSRRYTSVICKKLQIR